MARINRMKLNLREEAEMEKLSKPNVNDKLIELMSEDPAFLSQKELNKKYPPGSTLLYLKLTKGSIFQSKKDNYFTSFFKKDFF